MVSGLVARTAVIKPLRGLACDPFWDGAARGELLIQQCPSCWNRWHPPGPSCPRCGRLDPEWVPASGRAELYSLVVVRRAAHPLVESWLPYNVALVELEEGPRLVTTVQADDPATLPFGTDLIVDFHRITPDFVLPFFVPRVTNQNGITS